MLQTCLIYGPAYHVFFCIVYKDLLSDGQHANMKFVSIFIILALLATHATCLPANNSGNVSAISQNNSSCVCNVTHVERTFENNHSCKGVSTAVSSNRSRDSTMCQSLKKVQSASWFGAITSWVSLIARIARKIKKVVIKCDNRSIKYVWV